MRAAFPQSRWRGASARRAPLTHDQRRVLGGARRLAKLLDAQFNVFGFRFGLDSIIGVVPIAGDIVSASAGVYLLWVAKRLDLPTSALIRMAVNTVTDVGLGIVPVVGDLADAVFKANIRNVRIIESYVGREDGGVANR